MGEEPLPGGIANAGAVVRVGDVVLRPATARTSQLHALLRWVRQRGFDGVPEPLGIGDDGRERLRFVEGEVPIPPYPTWAQTDGALESIAALLRRYHEAAEGFAAPEADWSDEMADPAGGPVVCHNDVCLENVVFRDGEAIALLDFEFAAPGRPVHDLAAMARMCVPVDSPEDPLGLGWRNIDVGARLRAVADAYGLDAEGRAELLEVLAWSIARSGVDVHRFPEDSRRQNASGGRDYSRTA